MNNKSILIALICLMTYGKSINGQTSYERLVASPKIGLYTEGGVVFGLELNAVFNKAAFSLEFFHFEEFNIFGPEPTERYQQIGFMAGKHFQQEDKNYCFQIQGGIAPIWGVKRTKFLRENPGFLVPDTYESDKFTELGLAFKMGAKFNPMDELGIGLDLQMNINRKNPIFMILLGIEMGKL